MKSFELALILAVLGGSAAHAADPLFEDHSDQLGGHTYSGDWEFFVGGGAAVMDCNTDNRPDIFLAGGTSPSALYVNNGGFSFSLSSEAAITGVTGAYPLDIDGDGRMDLYVLRAGTDRILRGGPDCAFEDVTDAWGLPEADRWSSAFTAWWEDDGRPTLAVGHYVDRSDPEGPFEACDDNTLLWPDDDGWRVEELEPGFCALSILAARDARDRMTLRLSNDRHYYVRGGFEQMWDIKTHRFLTSEDGWPKISLWGMGIASADITGDGLDEVMLTSMGDQLLQIAQPDGTYRAAPFSIGTYAQRPFDGSDGRPSTGWHAQFGDIDNDGRPDLFIAKGNVDQMPTNAMEDPNNLLIQQGDGTFLEKADVARIATKERSRGAALADFDGDGLLDLVVVNRRAGAELYRNVTPDTGHWIGVSLIQPGGNRYAIGASVTVTAGDLSLTQQVVVGGGHAGGQALPLHFGLGKATQATITIRWPDPTLQPVSFTAPADRIVTVDRQ